jgi:hypothetical protein
MNRSIIQNSIILVCLISPVFGEVHLIPVDYATIQAAIDDCNDGDTVLVAPGTYKGDGNRDIDFKGKAITVKSEDGPDTCIIDCRGWSGNLHRGFYFHSEEDVNSILDGFTITNGYVRSGGGGILCFGSSPIIRNCIIVGNVAIEGGGIATGSSDCIVSNCIIVGNRTYQYVGSRDGGGIACGDGHAVFKNCTVYGNRSIGTGGGVICTSGRGTALLINCIITGNQATFGGNQIFAGGRTTRPGCLDLEVVNCCIENEPNAIFIEEGCSGPRISYIKADPKFAKLGQWDPNNRIEDPIDDFWIDGDYHLKSQAGRWDPNSQNWVRDDVTSPCIDAGDPNSPVGLEPFPNGGRINIGAYGGTIEASKSYFGEPICETIIAGDINGDCKVNFQDFVIMAANWLENGH